MIATIRNIRKLKRPAGVSAACRLHPWNRYSATAGDYFMAMDETVLTCSECDEPLRLVRFSEKMTEVTA
jgi:hypothetical protein